VAVTADGRRAVSASWDNTLKVWDLDSGTVIAGFTCDGPAVCCTFVGSAEIFGGDLVGRIFWLKVET
jgi:WD40 repeat protein